MSPLFRRRPRSEHRPEWVRVAIVANQAEGEMLQGMLANAGIPSFLLRNAGFDVPDMLAGGPRDVMVPGGRGLEAHALLDPLEPLEPDLP